MAIDTSRMLYEKALQNVSQLVLQRNELLYQLDELASLPLNISPASGHVAEFDARIAMQIIQRIDRQTVAITSALEVANRYAQECGMPQVDWLPMPRPKSDSLGVGE